MRSVIAISGLGLGGVATYFTLRSLGVVGELPRASGGNLLVDNLTLTSTKENFVRGVMSAAASADRTLSPTARALLAAWAAHESGWGKTRQAKLGFNLWNVSKGSWTGPTLPGGDLEFNEGSPDAKRITQLWRQYATLEAATADLLNLLKNSRFVNYREAHAALVAGDVNFATMLGVMERQGGTIVRVENRPNTAGFYTLPRSEYQRATNKLFNEVMLLAQNAKVAGLLNGTQS